MSEFTSPTYWDPYKREEVPVLTDEQVKGMWPYAKEKPVDTVISTKKQWREQDASLVNRLERPVPLLTPEGNLTSPPEVPRTKPTKLEEGIVINTVTAPERNVDMVTLPVHYARFDIEPIRFICENHLNFFQGNIIKYVLRHDAKNGLEDLKKARRYLDMFIKFVQKDPDWWRK